MILQWKEGYYIEINLLRYLATTCTVSKLTEGLYYSYVAPLSVDFRD